MSQSYAWYNSCQVCQGRRTVPCSGCSGIGHDTHVLVGAQAASSAVSGSASRTAVAAQQKDCTDCRGRGIVRCAACHGYGMKGTPSYAGWFY